MGEEKEILLRGKVCAYLTCRLMGDLLLDPPSACHWTLYVHLHLIDTASTIARAYQFGVRPRAFMQLLKASARLPAPAERAALRSHSDASWLSVLLDRLSLDGGALLL